MTRETPTSTRYHYHSYYIVGGNPNNDGGGLIETIADRFKADRQAAFYVAKGYRNVRVLTEDQFYAD